MAEFRRPEDVTLPRSSKGPRPHFFDDPAIDQVMTIVIELMTEVAVMRERMDTIERLLDTNGVVSRADVESYRADPAAEAERVAWRHAYLKRVMRMHAPD